MPSARRMRLAFVGVMAIVVMTLVYTSQLRQSQNPDVRTFGDFYGRTKSGLERARGGQQQQQSVLDSKGGTNKGDGDSDDAQLAKEMSDRLKAAEQKAKDSANAKAPRPDAPEKVIGVGNSAAGQDKSKDKAGNQLAEKETDEDHEVEIIINDILKKSPVIIFSKTYCQFSKRAKALLLDKYAITPEPYVVELDIHQLGRPIQDRLAKMTGRKTVPNIMINGKSIGGADDIAAMDNNHELVEKIRTLGSVGGKTVEVKERHGKQT
ncbi:hypothetical protein N8I77_003863 [Diaporthe amygdali]|uniref:Glutaredoxin domain-containing protein n=1 Tax=Phomopsis amygdali TaxID=1214568 RepID=A0AAD9W6C6_PHOAM|nr:hypothetical protein N8I77_003863 [Diaporthe amygdali]